MSPSEGYFVLLIFIASWKFSAGIVTILLCIDLTGELFLIWILI